MKCILILFITLSLIGGCCCEYEYIPKKLEPLLGVWVFGDWWGYTVFDFERNSYQEVTIIDTDYYALVDKWQEIDGYIVVVMMLTDDYPEAEYSGSQYKYLVHMIGQDHLGNLKPYGDWSYTQVYFNYEQGNYEQEGFNVTGVELRYNELWVCDGPQDVKGIQFENYDEYNAFFDGFRS